MGCLGSLDGHQTLVETINFIIIFTRKEKNLQPTIFLCSFIGSRVSSSSLRLASNPMYLEDPDRPGLLSECWAHSCFDRALYQAPEIQRYKADVAPDFSSL